MTKVDWKDQRLDPAAAKQMGARSPSGAYGPTWVSADAPPQRPILVMLGDPMTLDEIEAWARPRNRSRS